MAAPCPTSMNVTSRNAVRPKRRFGVKTIHAPPTTITPAAALRAHAITARPAGRSGDALAGREPHGPCRVVPRQDLGCGGRHPRDRPRHHVDEPGALDQPPRRQMGQPAHGGRSGRRERRRTHQHHPAGLNGGHQRDGREVQQQARRGHPREHEGAHREQGQFCRHGRSKQACGRPDRQRRRPHARQQRAASRRGSPPSRHRSAKRRRPRPRAGPAPCVNPAEAPIALYGLRPVIDGVGHQVHDGHRVARITEAPPPTRKA